MLRQLLDVAATQRDEHVVTTFVVLVDRGHLHPDALDHILQGESIHSVLCDQAFRLIQEQISSRNGCL